MTWCIFYSMFFTYINNEHGAGDEGTKTVHSEDMSTVQSLYSVQIFRMHYFCTFTTIMFNAPIHCTVHIFRMHCFVPSSPCSSCICKEHRNWIRIEYVPTMSNTTIYAKHYTETNNSTRIVASIPFTLNTNESWRYFSLKSALELQRRMGSNLKASGALWGTLERDLY